MRIKAVLKCGDVWSGLLYPGGESAADFQWRTVPVCRFYGADQGGKTIGNAGSIPRKEDTEALRLAIQKILDHPFDIRYLQHSNFPRCYFGNRPKSALFNIRRVGRLFSVGLFGIVRLIVSFLTIFLLSLFVFCLSISFQLYELTPSAVQICFCLTHYFHLCWTLFFFNCLRYILPLGSLYLLCIVYFSKCFHREKFSKKWKIWDLTKTGSSIKQKWNKWDLYFYRHAGVCRMEAMMAEAIVMEAAQDQSFQGRTSI